MLSMSLEALVVILREFSNQYLYEESSIDIAVSKCLINIQMSHAFRAQPPNFHSSWPFVTYLPNRYIVNNALS